MFLLAQITCNSNLGWLGFVSIDTPWTKKQIDSLQHVSHKNWEFSCTPQKVSEKKILFPPRSNVFPTWTPTFQQKNIPNVSSQPNKIFKKSPDVLVPNCSLSWLGNFRDPISQITPKSAIFWPELRRAVMWCRSSRPSDDRCHQPSGSPGMSSALWDLWFDSLGMMKPRGKMKFSRKWGKHFMVFFDFPSNFGAETKDLVLYEIEIS